LGGAKLLNLSIGSVCAISLTRIVVLAHRATDLVAGFAVGAILKPLLRLPKATDDFESRVRSLDRVLEAFR
jgi:hypothetical protein